MTVAEMIRETRVSHHMTQEEYGDKFGVTRQTVSSWENDKSIPDLEMLILICNTYHISLDVLLNEDAKYVNRMDVLKKAIKWMKKILIPLAVLCVVLLVVGLARYRITIKETEEFRTRAEAAGFSFENKIWVKREGNSTFELPNQVMPFWRNEFYNSIISGSTILGDEPCSIDLNYEDDVYTFLLQYGLDYSIEGSVDARGNVSYEKLSVDTEAFVQENEKEMQDIIKKMVYYYNVAYNIGQ